MDIKGKEYLTEQDLKLYSMWVAHQSDDLFYPVNGPEDLPEDMVFEDLCTRAIFTTSSGEAFFGYVIGLKNIFCIVLFLNNEMLIFNKNLYKDCLIAIEKINKITGQNLSVKDFSPLKFETQIDIEGFKNIQGEFDLSKPRTDEESLDF
jgi:hypothetical protein